MTPIHEASRASGRQARIHRRVSENSSRGRNRPAANTIRGDIHWLAIIRDDGEWRYAVYRAAARRQRGRPYGEDGAAARAVRRTGAGWRANVYPIRQRVL